MALDVVIDTAAVEALLHNGNGPIAQALARRAVNVQRTAMRLCPVDTGRLRASITWHLDNDEKGVFALVGTDVDYAIYQEFGTRFMKAQPFLRPALGAARDDTAAMAGEAIAAHQLGGALAGLGL